MSASFLKMTESSQDLGAIHVLLSRGAGAIPQPHSQHRYFTQPNPSLALPLEFITGAPRSLESCREVPGLLLPALLSIISAPFLFLTEHVASSLPDSVARVSWIRMHCF